jgi:hypothetical protein
VKNSNLCILKKFNMNQTEINSSLMSRYKWQETGLCCVVDPDPDSSDPHFFGLLDPDPSVRGTDSDSDPDPSIIKHSVLSTHCKQTLDSYYFVTSFDALSLKNYVL